MAELQVVLTAKSKEVHFQAEHRSTPCHETFWRLESCCGESKRSSIIPALAGLEKSATSSSALRLAQVTCAGVTKETDPCDATSNPVFMECLQLDLRLMVGSWVLAEDDRESVS